MPPTNDARSTANDSAPETSRTATSRPATSHTDAPTASEASTSASVLKAAALMFVLVGGGIATWTVSQWVTHPEIKATQFDATAPLWPAVTIFVVLATAAGVVLLWRAARRVEAGEDLYAARHRRSLDEMRNR